MKASSPAILETCAIALSGLCLIHCLVLPFLALSLPFFVAFERAEWVHYVFAGIALPLSFFGLRYGCTHHKASRGLIACAALGCLALMFGAVSWPSERWGIVITVCGSLLISAAHIYNRFLCIQQPRKTR